MKLYVAGDNGSQFPAFVLEAPNIDGICVRMPIVNFLFGKEYNNSFFNQFLNDLKVIASYNKEIAVAIIIGKFLPVMSGIRYATLHDAHHQNQIAGTTIIPTRQPVFWDDSFIEFHQNFFKWFSDRLKASEVYKSIKQIKITFANEKTEELKAGSDQDWRTKTDTSEMAYRQAAEVFASVGYNISKVKMVIGGAIDLFHELFPDKIICLPVIGSKNGTPCINVNGICKPSDREDIAKYLIEYGVDMYPEIFGCQSSALMVQGGTPKKVSQSSAVEIVYQVERLLYNPDPPFPASELNQQIFQQVINNGKANNGTICELFINSLRSFPNVHG